MAQDYYRFGFNGQEKDDEIFGSTGTSYTAEFWQYDTRIGRRWNLDPKPTIGISDYACFSNNPIWFNDPKGDSKRKRQAKAFAKKTGGVITKNKEGNFVVDVSGTNFQKEFNKSKGIESSGALGFTFRKGEATGKNDDFLRKAGVDLETSILSSRGFFGRLAYNVKKYESSISGQYKKKNNQAPLGVKIVLGFMTPFALINASTTLVSKQNMYSAKVDNLDKGLSVLTLSTFGLGNTITNSLLKTLSKYMSTATTATEAVKTTTDVLNDKKK